MDREIMNGFRPAVGVVAYLVSAVICIYSFVRLAVYGVEQIDSGFEAAGNDVGQISLGLVFLLVASWWIPRFCFDYIFSPICNYIGWGTFSLDGERTFRFTYTSARNRGSRSNREVELDDEYYRQTGRFRGAEGDIVDATVKDEPDDGSTTQDHPYPNNN